MYNQFVTSNLGYLSRLDLVLSASLDFVLLTVYLRVSHIIIKQQQSSFSSRYLIDPLNPDFLSSCVRLLANPNSLEWWLVQGGAGANAGCRVAVASSRNILCSHQTVIKHCIEH